MVSVRKARHQMQKWVRWSYYIEKINPNQESPGMERAYKKLVRASYRRIRMREKKNGN